jgi:hypothetical protein
MTSKILKSLTIISLYFCFISLAHGYILPVVNGQTDVIFINSFETDCTLSISPGESFIDSFAQLNDDDTLCLNDGTYQQAMDIPSNIKVKAIHDGKAEIDGGSTLGEQWTGGLLQMKGENSSVRGLRVHHAHNNADACNINGLNNTMQVMSCAHGGWHKHKKPVLLFIIAQILPLRTTSV